MCEQFVGGMYALNGQEFYRECIEVFLKYRTGFVGFLCCLYLCLGGDIRHGDGWRLFRKGRIRVLKKCAVMSFSNFSHLAKFMVVTYLNVAFRARNRDVDK